MQNIYDEPAFFAGYSELRRKDSGLNGAVEEPAVRALLPNSLEGASVLDLGCGFGDFARWLRRRGAAEVTGIDLSERMLEAAKRNTRDPAISFVRSSIERFEMGAEAFDLVVSSLALHYVEDYPAVVDNVVRALRPGGRFVFSVEHPVATALGTYEWHRDARGAPLHWKLDRYGDEGQRESRWFVDGVIKYHRTVQTYINALIDSGLVLRRVSEPEASAEAVQSRPDLAELRRRPAFLLAAADKAGE